ncbi:MAG: hypothetical protein Fur005_07470 [Roseiflexaceae bacterium]
MLTQTENWRPTLDRFQRMALIVGGVGAAICVVGALLGPAQFFHSFIFAFFFWMTVTIGASIVLMIQHLTGGVWGLMLRRMLEAAIANMPLMLGAFAVIVLGMGYLYEWSHPEAVAESEILQLKAPYLNTPFFIIRGVIYFAVFILIGTILNRWSLQQDALKSKEEAVALSHRMARLAGPGIPIFVLLWTLAATDWGMSLEPEWFSSMYPVTFIAEGLLATFAWSILGLSLMNSRKMLPYNVPVDRLHDLGKFMFGFTVVWTYINFSQFLIIWSGNIPEETPWYVHRFENGWQVLALMLMIGHFFIPFFALLSRHPKRSFTTVTPIAVFIIFIQAVFVFWSVTPSLYPDGFHIHWLDIVSLVALGGLWLGLWARTLKQRPLLPPNDPRMVELEKQAAGGHGHGHDHGKAQAAHH